jgi:hypothetical protein
VSAPATAANASPTARGALVLPAGATPSRPRPSQVCPGTPTASSAGQLGIMSTSPKGKADIAAACDASARMPATPARHPMPTPGGGVHFAPMMDPRSPTDASARTPTHNFGLLAPPCTPSTPAAVRQATGDASTRTPVAASPMRPMWPAQAFEQQWTQSGHPGAVQSSCMPSGGYQCAQGSLVAVATPTPCRAPTSPVPCYGAQAASTYCSWPRQGMAAAPDTLRDLVACGAPLPEGEALDRMLRAAAPEAYED